jgi:hypothetical protein
LISKWAKESIALPIKIYSKKKRRKRKKISAAKPGMFMTKRFK